MEKIVFPKWKLALAVITAPRQAFEEIIERKLLGTGLLITAVSGLLALALHLTGYLRGTSSIYDFGLYNPVTSVAWMLAASLIIYYMAKLGGGQGSLPDTVTVVGWAHVVSAVYYALYIGALFTPRLVSPAWLAYAYFAVVSVLAIERIHAIPLWKSAIVTVFGFFFLSIVSSAFNSLAAVTDSGANGVHTVAGMRPIGEPLYLAVLAILAGVTMFLVLRHIRWPAQKRLAPVLAVSVAALVAAGSMAMVTVVLKPGSYIKAARDAYHTGDYGKAESNFDRVLKVFPGDVQSQLYLGHTYLAEGRYKPAEQQFKDLLRQSTHGFAAPMDTARTYTGLGAVAYAQEDYKQAVSQFDNALKSWPNYREANSRKALALLKMGDLKEAGKAAEKALKDGADSAVPYAVLTQVYSRGGDPKKAKDNFGMVTTRDPKLADAIGRDPGNWPAAGERVPDRFLKYPFETEPSHVVKPQVPKKR